MEGKQNQTMIFRRVIPVLGEFPWATSLQAMCWLLSVLTLERGKQGCVRLLIADCWDLLSYGQLLYKNRARLPGSILLISGNIYLPSPSIPAHPSCVSKLSVIHGRGTTIDVVITVKKAQRHQSQLCSLLMISEINVNLDESFGYDATLVVYRQGLSCTLLSRHQST